MTDSIYTRFVPENSFLSDESPEDRPWDEHKDQACRVSECYAEVRMDRLAERVDNCAWELAFGYNDQKQLKLKRARFCRKRHCPICQWRRSLMWRARAYQRLPKLMEETPNVRWVLLTLTVKNCAVDELRNTLREMNAAWKRLIERKKWPALGFFRATEITRGQDGSAHPHFHVLMVVKSSYFSRRYISQAKWADMWQDCLGVDYTPIVDVRTVKVAQNDSEGVSGLPTAIQEVLKYTTKPSDLTASPEWLKALTEQTHKLRFIATGGILKDALGDIEPKTDEELIHAVDEEEATANGPTIPFQFDRDKKRYRALRTRN